MSKLLAQIKTYLPELSDNFKIEITHSVYLLFVRLPDKSNVLIKFLFECLTGEGNKPWKESIVETLMKIGREGANKDRDDVLHSVSEFMEDCQFEHLSTNIIDYVAREAKSTSNPSFYIRYIYNRIILEKALIRAAAVSGLGTMAYQLPDLRQ